MHLSDMLAIPCNTILNMLIKLQSHALEKLASIAQFQQTGLATLRIKIVGGSGVQKNIAMSLNESGESLKRRIISEMNQLPINRFDRFLIFKNEVQIIYKIILKLELQT